MAQLQGTGHTYTKPEGSTVAIPVHILPFALLSTPNTDVQLI
jgi:hypothetical protein